MTFFQWIDQQRNLCEKAIPGPWRKTRTSFDGKAFIIHGNGDEWDRLECRISTDDCDAIAARRTGRFIIASRLSLPKALRIIEDLAEAVGLHDAAVIAERIINEKTD